ncbi:MAG: hypothetical protein WCL51_15395 [Bacteroidota bacterium]
MTEKEIDAKLIKTLNAINRIGSFPQENIVAFVNGCITANGRTPIDAKVQIIINRSAIPFANVINTFTIKKADIMAGSSDVVTYNGVRDEFYLDLKDFKGDVAKLMPRNKAIMVLLGLDKISDYLNYSQSALYTSISAMAINVGKTPELSTLIIKAEALKSQIIDPFDVKEEQFTNIRTGRTKMTTVKAVLKICLRANYGDFLGMFAENPELIFVYFPIELLYSRVKSPDQVNKNQKLIQNPAAAIFCINDLKIPKNGSLKVDCMGEGGMKIWRSFTIATVAPQGCPQVNANSRDIFANGALGADDCTYLMCEVSGALDKVKIMLTARPRKRS